jgi:hypothetical protein
MTRSRQQHWCPACKVFVFVCDHWIAPPTRVAA